MPRNAWFGSLAKLRTTAGGLAAALAVLTAVGAAAQPTDPVDLDQPHTFAQAPSKVPLSDSAEAPDADLVDIPDAYRTTYERIERGEPFVFDDSSYMFVAGLAAELIEACGLPSQATDRVELWTFVQGAILRAGVGPNYSNPDIGENIGQVLGGQAAMTAGILAVRSLSCDSATARELAGDVLALVRSNDARGADGQSPFTRSCLNQFSAFQCDCLASLGRGVFPNINQMEYSRGLMAELINRNPILALQVALQCQIGNY